MFQGRLRQPVNQKKRYSWAIFAAPQSSDKEDVAAAGESHLLYLSQEGELHTTCGPWSSEVRLVWLWKNKKADSWSKVFY